MTEEMLIKMGLAEKGISVDDFFPRDNVKLIEESYLMSVYNTILIEQIMEE